MVNSWLLALSHSQGYMKKGIARNVFLEPFWSKMKKTDNAKRMPKWSPNGCQNRWKIKVVSRMRFGSAFGGALGRKSNVKEVVGGRGQCSKEID